MSEKLIWKMLEVRPVKYEVVIFKLNGQLMRSGVAKGDCFGGPKCDHITHYGGPESMLAPPPND